MFSLELSLALSALVLLSALSLLLVLRLTRRTAAAGMRLATLETEAELLRDELAMLKRELAGLQVGAGGEKEITQPVADLSYTRAMHLAESGLDAAALASQCGLSRGEAELIIALCRAAPRN